MRLVRFWLFLVALGGLAGSGLVFAGVPIEGGLILLPLAVAAIVGMYCIRPQRQSAPSKAQGAPAKGNQPHG